MLTSLFFVVAGFIESAFVLHLYESNQKHLMMQQAVNNLLAKRKNEMENLSKKESGNPIKPKYNVQKIDLVAFSVGVLLVVLFNVIYWLTLLVFISN